MARHRRNRRIPPGAEVSNRELVSISGEPVLVPDPQRLVHLQFRRFAGCPMCHLHLQALRTRHTEIEAVGTREVVGVGPTGREGPDGGPDRSWQEPLGQMRSFLCDASATTRRPVAQTLSSSECTSHVPAGRSTL